MDLSTFPFDAQNLQLCIKPHRLSIEKMILLPLREESTMDAHPEHEWRTLSHCAKEYATDPALSTTGKVYSSIHIIVLLQREGGWFVNNIMIVSCGLILCALTTFSMESHDSQGRMDVGVLTMLAAISNKFVVGDQLPKVPYRTTVDIYLDVSFFLHILIILTNVIVYYVSENHAFGWLGEEENCNFTIFVFVAIFYGGYHLYLLQNLRSHALDVEEWKAESDNAGNPDFKPQRRHSFFHVAGHALYALSHHQ